MMTSWKELYTELTGKLSGIPDIKWTDLWYKQISYLDREHPFPAPAIFIAFRVLNTEDMGAHIQNANVQVDVYYFYETLADTFSGSANQDHALRYLDTLTEIHRRLHGTDGDTYSNMRRIAMDHADTAGAGILYRLSFSCVVQDTSAAPDMDTAVPGDLNVTPGEEPDDNTDPVFNL